MGGVMKTTDLVPAVPIPGANTEAQVAHLTKLVHILWKEAERLEQIVQVIPEGLRIKTGMSEILVLKNGGIILNGLRIHLKTPGKDELMY
ncbi:hypothetical protein SAMN05444161_9260 [Rhizobiales bacterium GAS191]|nr:hypothetical protein SAMN05444161_9260 [Rhizobiales bacterium GAS191]